jgi:hypothetical protein
MWNLQQNIVDDCSSTWRNSQMKIPPLESDFIQIQIWQPKIARQNISDTSECLLVSIWSRIMKRISARIHFCWDDKNCGENQSDQRHAGRLGNRRLRFVRLTVFCLCRWSRMFGRSKKSKRDPNAASGCRETWGTLSPWDSMRGSENERSVLHFSRQPLIAFDPRFVFPDRPNTHKRMQGTKVFRGANLRMRFSAWVTSPRHTVTYTRVDETTNISATTDPFRDPFRVSGPIQHA